MWRLGMNPSRVRRDFALHQMAEHFVGHNVKDDATIPPS